MLFGDFEGQQPMDQKLDPMDIVNYSQRNGKTVSIIIEFVKRSVQVKLHMN